MTRYLVSVDVMLMYEVHQTHYATRFVVFVKMGYYIPCKAGCCDGGCPGQCIGTEPRQPYSYGHFNIPVEIDMGGFFKTSLIIATILVIYQYNNCIQETYLKIYVIYTVYKMSIETVLEEITALRSDIKSLSKIVRKIKTKQDDPNGEKAAARAKNNGFNRKQAISEELRKFSWISQKESLCLEARLLVLLIST